MEVLMKSIKNLLSGIGCLLVALILFLLASLANWGVMLIPFFIISIIGCVFLLVGIFTVD
jgi:hypothetical protein